MQLRQAMQRHVELNVSVVIVTCDRADYLRDALESLKSQTYREFEVIVVNGPSRDRTRDVVADYAVKYVDVSVRNISKARNSGIALAVGDIIAFLDDDALASPTWLEEIIAAFGRCPRAGAAGGVVYYAGTNILQYGYIMIDMWGYPNGRISAPYDFNQANGIFFNTLVGANCAFRSKILREIGGFDEEIEYYHDEADVCVRIIKHGFDVLQLAGASIEHRVAPSNLRDASAKIVNWEPIVKNTIYFGLKHSKGRATFFRRATTNLFKEVSKFRNLAGLLVRNQYTFVVFLARCLGLVRAICRGVWRGFRAQEDCEPLEVTGALDFKHFMALPQKPPSERLVAGD